MGVTREDVRQACDEAEKACRDAENLFSALEAVTLAINTTGNFFSQTVNPVRHSELPYIIASLDSIVEHLKTLDKGATETAADMKELFKTRSVGVSGVLADAMRAMEGKKDEED